MKPQHTPGPWKHYMVEHPDGKIKCKPYIYAPNGPGAHKHIAVVFYDESANQEIKEAQKANARLIAAAPELFQSLEALLYQWDNHKILGGMTLQDARAAIKKALGE